MKTKIASVLILASLALSGCASFKDIPAMNADTVYIATSNPAGGSKIEATKLRIENDTLKADSAALSVVYPSYSFQMKITGYSRTLDRTEKAETK